MGSHRREVKRTDLCCKFGGFSRNASAKQAASDGEKLLALLRPVAGRTPLPSSKYLHHWAKRWQRLPRFGRMRIAVKLDDELAVAVGMMVVTITTAPKPSFKESKVIIGICGLHSVARRYQRSAQRSDQAIFDDLVPLARASFGLAGIGDFAVECPSGGRWIGNFDPKKYASARRLRDAGPSKPRADHGWKHDHGSEIITGGLTPNGPFVTERYPKRLVIEVLN
jgi:hypothetical protein